MSLPHVTGPDASGRFYLVRTVFQDSNERFETAWEAMKAYEDGGITWGEEGRAL